jgi:hypothetical protein
MKSIVTHTVSIIAATLIAGATLFAATKVAAQEAPLVEGVAVPLEEAMKMFEKGIKYPRATDGRTVSMKITGEGQKKELRGVVAEVVVNVTGPVTTEGGKICFKPVSMVHDATCFELFKTGSTTKMVQLKTEQLGAKNKSHSIHTLIPD